MFCRGKKKVKVLMQAPLMKSVVLMSSLSITPSGCGLCEACVSQIILRVHDASWRGRNSNSDKVSKRGKKRFFR